MAKTIKIPVSRRALIQRINRALAKDGEKLVTSRGAQEEQQLGGYYTIDISRNAVTGMHVDLEECGRNIGALKPNETVVD